MKNLNESSWLQESRSSRSWAILAVLFFGNLLLYSTLAESLVPPPKPAVPPFIAETYPNDADGDRIDDQLALKARQAFAAQNAAVTSQQQSQAEAALAAPQDVELVFKQPVTQQQIDKFIGLGGEITHLYKAVSYGWNGRIPLGKVVELPAAMGAALVLIDGPKAIVPTMLEATRVGRVRPIWAPGFAGQALGFEGNTNITIAFVENGVDETHPDLVGRTVYRQNFTDELSPASGDHGTHLAGIALGTGVAGGNDPGTLFFSVVGSLSGLSAGQYYPMPFELPNGPASVTMTAQWNGGGSTTMALCSYDKGTVFSNSTCFNPTTGTSPLAQSFTITGDARRVFTPKLESNGSITDYVLTCQVSNYPAAGDGFNKLRGVAPGCNLADAKMGLAAGTGTVQWMEDAIDDLTLRRAEYNIKVMNVAWNVTGEPGLSIPLRQKINTAVNNGIMVILSAGDDGANSTEPQRVIDDPGRAAFGLTVGGAGDNTQLLAVTGHGFNYPSTTPGEEEDFKPDLLAPGGSRFGTFILAPDNNAGDGAAFPDQQLNDYVGMGGSSMATAFASGCVALVIEAMERQGITWDFSTPQHALFVKTLLCATASESNLPRFTGGFDPILQRAANGPNGFPRGKDPYEGYGMINPDAAVEAVCLACPTGGNYTNSLGGTPADRRVWARNLTLAAGQIFVADLTVPSTGDFDLYLYSAEPGLYGNPVILASSTRAASGMNESLNYLPPTNTPALLVVKRVSGSGQFTLVPRIAPDPVLVSRSVNGSDWALSYQTLAGRRYYIEYKDFINDAAWQQLSLTLGDGNVKVLTTPIIPGARRFYRLRVE